MSIIFWVSCFRSSRENSNHYNQIFRTKQKFNYFHFRSTRKRWSLSIYRRESTSTLYRFKLAKVDYLKKIMIFSHFDNWYKFMIDEMNFFNENDIYIFVSMLFNQKVLEKRWVYKLKKNFKEEILKYKTRWIIRDFEQRYEINFNEFFAIVVKFMIYKVVFAITTLYNWNIQQMNVKIVFLNEFLNEVVYVEILIEFEKLNMICKLNKVLYNLKQISRV